MRSLGELEGYYVHWHWYIDRLADVAVGHLRGVVTDAESNELTIYYEFLWRHC